MIIEQVTRLRTWQLRPLRVLTVNLFFCFSVLGIAPIAYAEPPTTPGNFSHTVYSSTAAEVFWQRSVDDTGVRGYELLRNGELIGIYDALSYFDDTLTPGVEYLYTLRAVDYDGDHSGQTTTLLTPRTAEDRIASLQGEIDSLNSLLSSRVPAPIPATGQTTIHLDGDDGDWQAGVSHPQPRLTVNVNPSDDLDANGECNDNEVCNGTVTDHLTGLIWLRNANCFGAVNLPEAIAQANNLAGDSSSTCGLTDGSRIGDWRIPNVRETISVAALSNFAPMLPTDHPFDNVISFEVAGNPARYWTSTAVSSGAAYAFSYGVGWLERWWDQADFHVWPVRQ